MVSLMMAVRVHLDRAASQHSIGSHCDTQKSTKKSCLFFVHRHWYDPPFSVSFPSIPVVVHECDEGWTRMRRDQTRTPGREKNPDHELGIAVALMTNVSVVAEHAVAAAAAVAVALVVCVE